MCFYDQTVLACGDFKWGNCRQQCAREYRSGETCGLKLVMTCYADNSTKCKTCLRIDTVSRKRQKECDNIRAWEKDEKAGKKRSASIEKAYNAIADYDSELSRLWNKIQSERSSLTGMHPRVRGLNGRSLADTSIGRT